MTEDRLDDMQAVAASLSLDASDETARAALELADDLQGFVASAMPESDADRESRGRDSDDPYNALLDTYETPRTETGEGPLAGLTVAVKDCIAVRDLAMTCGAAGMAYVPPFDASVVDRLLAAGASVAGKANMDAFAFGPTGEFSGFGRVENPAAPGRVPGGSSSGSAAAVAGGLVDVALGTDTGGSVRAPAACCGVVGLKPTHGLVPRHGFVDLAPSVDTIGPMARDVETTARAFATIAGADLRDGSTRGRRAPFEPDALPLDLEGEEIAVGVPDGFLDTASTPVRETIEGVADALDDERTVDVRKVELDLGDIARAYPLVIATEFAWVLRQGFVPRAESREYDPALRAALADAPLTTHVALRVLPAAYLDETTDGSGYLAAQREATAFAQRVDALFDTVDVLLTPTLPILPPRYGEHGAEGVANVLGNTAPFNLTGLPAVTVPCGSVEGVPVGAQLVAPAFEERRALRAAGMVERVTD